MQFTWNPKGYNNAFLVGEGPAVALSPAAFKLLHGEGMPHIAEDDHPWMLDSVLHQSGLSRSALEQRT